MVIAAINAVPFGSTGNIMFKISELAQEELGVKYFTYSKYSTIYRKGHTYIGTKTSNKITAYFSAVTGWDGKFARFSTKKLIRQLKQIKPTILHLHNLHGYYLNYGMLFDYIKTNNIFVVWTLHDCWAFTGHCPYFTLIGCEKWKTQLGGCHHCVQYRQYPQSKRDTSRKMYALKKKWFTGVPNMRIVTPSKWLASKVKQSFLKEYTIEVIPNGIDLNIFKPIESCFREKYHLKDKKIILGVSFDWGKKKGLDVFEILAKELPTEYQIVLVGVNEDSSKQLSDNILCIEKTHNQKELAEMYSAADVFVNPTREDNYPTVNMEALACGTPVITFNTGGSPEMLDNMCGSVIDVNDIQALKLEIVRICLEKPYSREACLKKTREFDQNDKFKKYIDLYKEY